MTSAQTGQCLCEACNQAKEASGWSAQVVADGVTSAGRAGRHRVRLRTPTGHTYRVRARSSCFCNLSVTHELCRGCLIADVPAIVGSLDIVMGEIDR